MGLDHHTSLPPLAGGGGRGGSASRATSAPLSKLAGLLHAGSRDLAAAAAADGELVVSRSPLSGSSKAPFPPDRSSLHSDFDWTKHSRDLPPEVRPIIEDNRMLQEELRRYRARVGEQEGALAAAERAVRQLKEELARERQRLRECAVSPEQLLQDQQFRQALADRDAAILQLQQRGEVLERAKLAADRRAAGDLAAERRAQAELRKELAALRGQLEEKDKQDRLYRLQINQLYRRLAPLEAAVAAAAEAAQAPPPPPPPPPPEPEIQVRLMLVHIYAQPQPTAAEIAEAAARLAAEEAKLQAAQLLRRQVAAAVRIQAAARGFLARCRLAAQHAAATAIQAAARGMLVRRALAAELGETLSESAAEAAAVGLAPGERRARRRQAAEQQYQERLAAGKSKPQRRLPPRPSTRTANTAVEAALRQRLQQQLHQPQLQQAIAGSSSSGSTGPGGSGGQGRRHSSVLGPGRGLSPGSGFLRRASAVAAVGSPSSPAKAGSSPAGGPSSPAGTADGSPGSRGVGSVGRVARQGSDPSAVAAASTVPRLDLRQGQGLGGGARRAADSKSTAALRLSDGCWEPKQGSRRESLGFGTKAPRLSMAGQG